MGEQSAAADPAQPCRADAGYVIPPISVIKLEAGSPTDLSTFVVYAAWVSQARRRVWISAGVGWWG
jgi:hypothetical protein